MITPQASRIDDVVVVHNVSESYMANLGIERKVVHIEMTRGLELSLKVPPYYAIRNKSAKALVSEALLCAKAYAQVVR